jgi:type I restriction enzyme S subunit
MTTPISITIAELAEVNPPVTLCGLSDDDAVSFIPMSDVTDSGRWVNRQERRLTDIRVGYTPFMEGDILFAKITPFMENGKGTHAVGLKNGVGFGSTEFHVLRARGSNNPRFLFHWLQSPSVRTGAMGFMGGSAGQQRVQSDFFSHFRIVYFQGDEQARIAAVLDAVDEAIGKTEALIVKLKQVRAGLLHHLLTRGLDENGEIRDPIFNPNQFKDSPLGKIPNGWEAKEIKDCYLIPSRNGLYKKVSSYGFGHRMIHMPQMFKSTIVETNEAVRVEVTPAELQRYALEEGDLLFARRSLNLEGAGLCSIVPELKEPVTFESSIIRVRLDRRKILPHFAVEFLRSPKGYLLRRPFIRQVAVSGVSSEDVGQFLLPCPEPSEQERILSVLEIYDQALSLFEKKLVKLNSIKEGLMSDLLSGRVRVPEGII